MDDIEFDLELCDGLDEVADLLKDLKDTSEAQKIVIRDFLSEKITSPFFNTDTISHEELKVLSPYIDKSDENWQKFLQKGFLNAPEESIDTFIPFMDEKDTEWQKSIKRYLLQAQEDKAIDLLLPMLDKSQLSDKDNVQQMLSETHNEKLAEFLINLGADIQLNQEELLSNGFFHKEFAEQYKNADEDGLVHVSTKFGEMIFSTEEDDMDLIFNSELAKAKYEYTKYYISQFEYHPGKMSEEDAHEAVRFFKEFSLLEINNVTHGMCHGFEKGYMSEEKNRKIGNIILDAILEYNDRGAGAHAERSVFGYWDSIKDNPDTWDDLRKVLEKHPNNPLSMQYLGYMNGEKQKDISELRDIYLKDPKMKFVEDVMIDIDGTLLIDGKLNLTLIANIWDNQRMCAFKIYSGGESEYQRKTLLKTVEEYEKTLKEGERNYAVSQFKKYLQSGGKIYPKEAFMQEHICLGRGTFDDTLPENQGIKSLVSYGLLEQQSYKKIPEERKITAEQVFEMYNMSQQISQKLQKLRDKSPTGKLEDIPHAKTQILRVVGEDNLGKPKRSKAEKEIVKSAIETAIQNTK